MQFQSFQGEAKSKFSTLSEEEKNSLLDKFCVGDAFNHELSMTTDGLPRSYLVKQCRDELYKMCQIDPPDANFEEAKVNSVKLFSKNISLIISKRNNDFKQPSKFILLSFSILQTGESVMHAKGNSKLFELHKSVKIFTGQGVDKDNDVAHAISLQKS